MLLRKVVPLLVQRCDSKGQMQQHFIESFTTRYSVRIVTLFAQKLLVAVEGGGKPEHRAALNSIGLTVQQIGALLQLNSLTQSITSAGYAVVRALQECTQRGAELVQSAKPLIRLMENHHGDLEDDVVG